MREKSDVDQDAEVREGNNLGIVAICDDYSSQYVMIE